MTDPAPRAPLDLEPIKARLFQASSGPWKPYDNYVEIPTVGAVQFDTGNPIEGDSSHDTHFVAHAREDIPALLAEVEALRAALASPELFGVYRAGELMVAYPRRLQAEVYVSGFSSPRELEVRPVALASLSASQEPDK